MLYPLSYVGGLCDKGQNPELPPRGRLEVSQNACVLNWSTQRRRRTLLMVSSNRVSVEGGC